MAMALKYDFSSEFSKSNANNVDRISTKNINNLYSRLNDISDKTDLLIENSLNDDEKIVIKNYVYSENYKIRNIISDNDYYLNNGAGIGQGILALGANADMGDNSSSQSKINLLKKTKFNNVKNDFETQKEEKNLKRFKYYQTIININKLNREKFEKKNGFFQYPSVVTVFKLVGGTVIVATNLFFILSITNPVMWAGFCNMIIGSSNSVQFQAFCSVMSSFGVISGPEVIQLSDLYFSMNTKISLLGPELLKKIPDLTLQMFSDSDSTTAAAASIIAKTALTYAQAIFDPLSATKTLVETALAAAQIALTKAETELTTAQTKSDQIALSVAQTALASAQSFFTKSETDFTQANDAFNIAKTALDLAKKNSDDATLLETQIVSKDIIKLFSKEAPEIISFIGYIHKCIKSRDIIDTFDKFTSEKSKVDADWVSFIVSNYSAPIKYSFSIIKTLYEFTSFVNTSTQIIDEYPDIDKSVVLKESVSNILTSKTFIEISKKISLPVGEYMSEKTISFFTDNYAVNKTEEFIKYLLSKNMPPVPMPMQVPMPMPMPMQVPMPMPMPMPRPIPIPIPMPRPTLLETPTTTPMPTHIYENYLDGFFGSSFSKKNIESVFISGVQSSINIYANKMTSMYFYNITEKMKQSKKDDDDSKSEKEIILGIEKQVEELGKFKGEGYTNDEIADIIDISDYDKEKSKYAILPDKFVSYFIKNFTIFFNNPSMLLYAFWNVEGVYNIMSKFFINTIKGGVVTLGSGTLEKLTLEGSYNTVFLKMNWPVEFELTIKKFVDILVTLIIGSSDTVVKEKLRLAKNKLIQNVINDFNIIITDITSYGFSLLNTNSVIKKISDTTIFKIFKIACSFIKDILVIPEITKKIQKSTPAYDLDIIDIFSDRAKLERFAIFLRLKSSNLLDLFKDLSVENIIKYFTEFLDPNKIKLTYLHPYLVGSKTVEFKEYSLNFLEGTVLTLKEKIGNITVDKQYVVLEKEVDPITNVENYVLMPYSEYNSVFNDYINQQTSNGIIPPFKTSKTTPNSNTVIQNTDFNFQIYQYYLNLWVQEKIISVLPNYTPDQVYTQAQLDFIENKKTEFPVYLLNKVTELEAANEKSEAGFIKQLLAHIDRDYQLSDVLPKMAVDFINSKIPGIFNIEQQPLGQQKIESLIFDQPQMTFMKDFIKSSFLKDVSKSKKKITKALTELSDPTSTIELFLPFKGAGRAWNYVKQTIPVFDLMDIDKTIDLLVDFNIKQKLYVKLAALETEIKTVTDLNIVQIIKNELTELNVKFKIGFSKISKLLPNIIKHFKININGFDLKLVNFDYNLFYTMINSSLEFKPIINSLIASHYKHDLLTYLSKISDISKKCIVDGKPQYLKKMDSPITKYFNIITNEISSCKKVNMSDLDQSDIESILLRPEIIYKIFNNDIKLTQRHPDIQSDIRQKFKPLFDNNNNKFLDYIVKVNTKTLETNPNDNELRVLNDMLTRIRDDSILSKNINILSYLFNSWSVGNEKSFDKLFITSSITESNKMYESTLCKNSKDYDTLISYVDSQDHSGDLFFEEYEKPLVPKYGGLRISAYEQLSNPSLLGGTDELITYNKENEELQRMKAELLISLNLAKDRQNNELHEYNEKNCGTLLNNYIKKKQQQDKYRLTIYKKYLKKIGNTVNEKAIKQFMYYSLKINEIISNFTSSVTTLNQKLTKLAEESKLSTVPPPNFVPPVASANPSPGQGEPNSGTPNKPGNNGAVLKDKTESGIKPPSQDVSSIVKESINNKLEEQISEAISQTETQAETNMETIGQEQGQTESLSQKQALAFSNDPGLFGAFINGLTNFMAEVKPKDSSIGDVEVDDNVNIKKEDTTKSSHAFCKSIENSWYYQYGKIEVIDPITLAQAKSCEQINLLAKGVDYWVITIEGWIKSGGEQIMKVIKLFCTAIGGFLSWASGGASFGLVKLCGAIDLLNPFPCFPLLFNKCVYDYLIIPDSNGFPKDSLFTNILSLFLINSTHRRDELKLKLKPAQWQDYLNACSAILFVLGTDTTKLTSVIEEYEFNFVSELLQNKGYKNSEWNLHGNINIGSSPDLSPENIVILLENFLDPTEKIDYEDLVTKTESTPIDNFTCSDYKKNVKIYLSYFFKNLDSRHIINYITCKVLNKINVNSIGKMDIFWFIVNPFKSTEVILELLTPILSDKSLRDIFLTQVLGNPTKEKNKNYNRDIVDLFFLRKEAEAKAKNSNVNLTDTYIDIIKEFRADLSNFIDKTIYWWINVLTTKIGDVQQIKTLKISQNEMKTNPIEVFQKILKTNTDFFTKGFEINEEDSEILVKIKVKTVFSNREIKLDDLKDIDTLDLVVICETINNSINPCSGQDKDNIKNDFKTLITKYNTFKKNQNSIYQKMEISYVHGKNSYFASVFNFIFSANNLVIGEKKVETNWVDYIFPSVRGQKINPEDVNEKIQILPICSKHQFAIKHTSNNFVLCIDDVVVPDSKTNYDELFIIKIKSNIEKKCKEAKDNKDYYNCLIAKLTFKDSAPFYDRSAIDNLRQILVNKYISQVDPTIKVMSNADFKSQLINFFKINENKLDPELINKLTASIDTLYNKDDMEKFLTEIGKEFTLEKDLYVLMDEEIINENKRGEEKDGSYLIYLFFKKYGIQRDSNNIFNFYLLLTSTDGLKEDKLRNNYFGERSTNAQKNDFTVLKENADTDMINFLKNPANKDLILTETVLLMKQNNYIPVFLALDALEPKFSIPDLKTTIIDSTGKSVTTITAQDPVKINNLLTNDIYSYLLNFTDLFSFTPNAIDKNAKKLELKQINIDEINYNGYFLFFDLNENKNIVTLAKVKQKPVWAFFQKVREFLNVNKHYDPFLFETTYISNCPAPILFLSETNCSKYDENNENCVKKYIQQKNNNPPSPGFKKNNKMEYIIHMYDISDNYPSLGQMNNDFICVLKGDISLLENTFKNFDKKKYTKDLHDVLTDKTTTFENLLDNYEIEGIQNTHGNPLKIPDIVSNPKFKQLMKQFTFSIFQKNANSLLFGKDFIMKFQLNIQLFTTYFINIKSNPTP
jgi:hypothetical protein